jgi:hypothetical protein
VEKENLIWGLDNGHYRWYYYRPMETTELLVHIHRLHARRRQLLAGLRLPEEGLPGSLVESRGRCGSPGCHCQQEGGHPSWTLTFMVEGKKRVEHIPNELVEAVQRRVEEGKLYKSEVAELMAINAQLLVLERRARRQQEALRKKRGSR